MKRLHPTPGSAFRWRALTLAVASCALLGTSAALAQTAEPAPAPIEPDAIEDVQQTSPADSNLAQPPAANVYNGLRPTSRKVRLHAKSHNVVRSGPGDGFAIAGVHPKGATFPVIAKSGEWYNVRLSPSETGWIHSSLCKEFEDLSDLEFRPNPKLYSRTGSFVLGGYAGGYAFDRKSNSLVLGGRVGYYVFDRLQAEGGVAWTRIQRPAEIVESLFDLSLESEKFHMLFYHLNLTWELLPGRQMVPFLGAGVGSAIMLGRTEPSFNFGAGTTMFLSKRTAMRWEVRDYVFDSGSDDARRTNNNIEFTLGTAFLF
ncbi:MAG TPA: outer membrane beta-barrel domain-containing protein [Candidatus Limnocylindria bacterium]|nr:outer membrane beta-barrel domain-containing protein [Candidatus Limnocylindria bacterium]